MKWKVRFSEKVNDDLSDLDNQIRERIIEKIKWFSKNFEDITPLPLTDEYSGFYKLRVGDYRAIYDVE